MTIKLPPMPLPDKQGCEDDPMYGIRPVSYYTDKQMEAYAREAVRLNIAAERERLALLAESRTDGYLSLTADEIRRGSL